ncbi:glycosyltransferase [Candidatus Woesearchaeota archaeon]|nr:glycosyltransferase [Candidatus Woesearchaeota archaeon]
MKKNILAIIPSSTGGGAERLVLDQIRYNNKEKFDYDVAALRKGNIEDEFSKHEEYKNLGQDSRFSLSSFRRLRKIVKEHKIDILHSHLIEADFYAWLLSMTMPKVRWISTRHAKDPFRKSIFWGLFNRLMAVRSSKIIAVSESVGKFIKRYEFIPDKKIEVVHNGIDTERFKKTNQSLRDEFGFSKEDIIIGIVGRVEEGKGHKVLLDAVAEMEEKIKALIVGTGQLEENIKRYVEEKGLGKRVIFAGFRNDIQKMFNTFDIFCLPSESEGLPLVVVEAMSCELPVICSDIDSHKNIIEDGKDGLLFKVGDEEQLKLAIRKLVSEKDVMKNMGKNARDKAVNEFDIKDNIKNIEKLYLRI